MYGEALPQGLTPSSLRRVPPSYTFYEKKVPLSYTYVRTLYHYHRSTSYISRFPNPFIYLNLSVKKVLLLGGASLYRPLQGVPCPPPPLSLVNAMHVKSLIILHTSSSLYIINEYNHFRKNYCSIIQLLLQFLYRSDPFISIT